MIPENKQICAYYYDWKETQQNVSFLLSGNMDEFCLPFTFTFFPLCL